MAHSAAKQKTKKVVGKLIFSLLVGNVGNLKCKRLSTVCISLKRSICCGFAWRRKGEAFFSCYAILHGTGGSIAAVLWLNEQEGGGGRQKKMDGWKEGTKGFEGVCPTDCSS